MAESNENSTIEFYREDEKYGEFSNFYPSPITIDGKEWATTEHFFQAMKYEGTDREELIRNAKTPKEAFTLGRDRNFQRREDWNSVKDDIMLKGLRAKFTQHKDLNQLLLWTGKRKLVEHTENDAYWGDGGDGTGKNMMGNLLMKLREELQK